VATLLIRGHDTDKIVTCERQSGARETKTGDKTMAQLRKITSLDSFEKAVALTAKTVQVYDDNGPTGEVEPNPNYEKAVRRLEAARYHFDARNKIVEAAKKIGFGRNQYDKVCNATGVEVKAFTGFVKKNDAGKWETFSWDHVVEVLCVNVIDLPEIED
jgi:hypothetical protein